jgi:AraC-like DNA-binding protein
MVVENELNSLGTVVQEVKLGYADVILPSTLTLEEIDFQIKKFGFELIYDVNIILIEQTKIVILDYLKLVQLNRNNALKLSTYISLRIGKNYNSISKIFSRQTGNTLEKYYIHIRIEKENELMDYDQLKVSEIAIKLGHSSFHYLSNQFKKVTGFSNSDYRKKARADRTILDGLLTGFCCKRQNFIQINQSIIKKIGGDYIIYNIKRKKRNDF